MKVFALSRLKLVCSVLPTMVVTAWALEMNAKFSPESITTLETEYSQEQDKIELEILKFQVQCLAGEISGEECQAAIGEWALKEQNRLVAQAGRAELLDKLLPLSDSSLPDVGKAAASSEEAHLEDINARIAKAIEPLRREAATPFEAQEKVDRWAHEEEGMKLLKEQEELQRSINLSNWLNLTSVELEEPANATPAQLAVVDAEEKIQSEWLAIKVSVPDSDPFKVQALVAQAEARFEPLRTELAKANDVARLEELRQRAKELEEKILSGRSR